MKRVSSQPSPTPRAVADDLAGVVAELGHRPVEVRELVERPRRRRSIAISASVTTGEAAASARCRAAAARARSYWSVGRSGAGVSIAAMSRFGDTLNGQIGYEFAASQQYVAIAVHYDAQTLPQLAAHFYRQAVEERNHAMMMVQYLLDADEAVAIPGVEAPQTEFADVVAPVALALEQEKRVTEQIADLVKLAREEGELVGEQFLHWFLQEQREEVSSMSALLAGRRALARQRHARRGLPRPRVRRREPARGRRAARGRRRALAAQVGADPRFAARPARARRR